MAKYLKTRLTKKYNYIKNKILPTEDENKIKKQLKLFKDISDEALNYGIQNSKKYKRYDEELGITNLRNLEKINELKENVLNELSQLNKFKKFKKDVLIELKQLNKFKNLRKKVINELIQLNKSKQQQEHDFFSLFEIEAPEIKEKEETSNFLNKVKSNLTEEKKDIIITWIDTSNNKERETYFRGVSINDYGDIKQYFNPIPLNYPLFNKISSTGNLSRVISDISYMFLNDIKYMKLPGNLPCNKIIYNYNCVSEYISIFPNLRDYYNKTDWTVNLLILRCEEKKVNYTLFDRDLQIIKSNMKFNNYKSVYALLSNSHLYPMTKSDIKYLREYKKTDFVINDIVYNENLNELIKQKMQISSIDKFSIYGTKISKFLHNEILYTNNKDTVEHYHIFNKILNNPTIPYDFNSNKILYSICKKYNMESIDILNNPKPILYSYNDDNLKNIISIDKNKCYLDMFLNLEYIPKIDFSCDLNPYNNEEIIKYNFYHIKRINIETLGLINVNWCSGYALIDFKNTEDDYILENIEIDYYIEPILYDNIFKNVIKELIEIDILLARNVINRFIGFCQKTPNEKVRVYKDLIYNKAEAIHFKKYPYEILELDNNIFCAYKDVEIEKKYSYLTMNPLTHYIIDRTKSMIFKKIRILREIDSDLKICKISTDSISFSSDIIEIEDLNLNKNDMHNWKLEDYKDRGDIRKFNKNACHELMRNFGNYYIQSLAGSGKTFLILNTLMPIIKKYNRDYIIISSQHNALEEYYNLNLNSKTIQSIIHNKIRLDNKIIIIDESGLLSYYHYKYLMTHVNRNQKLIFAGDIFQLNPVMEDNMPFGGIIKLYFDKFHKLETNYRNNFSKKFYYDIINETINPEQQFKINSYFRDYKQLMKDKIEPFIICYTNKKCDEINNHITKKWPSIKNKKILKGGFIRCISNDLKNKKIYNKNTFRVLDRDDTNKSIKIIKCKFPNDFGLEYTISYSEYIKYFKISYCNTLYSVQGMSIPSKHICLTEAKYLSNPRSLYTAISRIRNISVNESIEISKSQKNKEIFHNSDFMQI